MVKSALETITKIVDRIEKQWDEKIDEVTKSGGLLRISISNTEIDSGVFDELKKRYDKAGWDLSIPPKDKRISSDPYDFYPVSFNMKRSRS